MGQFGGLFGVSEGSGTTLEKFGNTLARDPDRDQRPDAGRVASRSSRRSSGLGRVNKKIPGALIAVVGTIVLELRRSTSPPTASRPSAPCPAACRASASRPR